ncbi:MAG: hypothetical protein JO285_00350 [Kutzneria sp.]|nr:hypothetical protein [Kutzneria sp.]
MLSRGLVTIGAAVGFTAAAWILTSATASAQSLGSSEALGGGPSAVSAINTIDSHSPETASTGAGVHELAGMVPTRTMPVTGSRDASAILDGTDQALAASNQAHGVTDVNRVADQLNENVNRVGGHLVDPKSSVLVGGSMTLVGSMVQGPLAKLPVELPISEIGLGQSGSGSTGDDAAVVADRMITAFVDPSVHGVASGDDRTADQQYARQMSPVPSSGRSGPRNSAPAPAAPATVPPAPSCVGNGGTGIPGGSSCADRLSFGNTLGAAATRGLRSFSQSVSVMPGKQPGITPD